MGWFWAETTSSSSTSPSRLPSSHAPVLRGESAASPPPGCPMHKRTVDALTGPNCKRSSADSCPVPHGSTKSSPCCSDSSLQHHPSKLKPQSTLSKLNPLNYMFSHISQSPSPNQSQALPTDRDPSSIPKGSCDGNWEYPSPQQMYNALLRKGYTDTDVSSVESMVAVHNFLNEGAWAEIVEWERRFSRGLGRGWRICSRGEENAPTMLRREEAMERMYTRDAPPGDSSVTASQPRLIRFQGRPTDMTPKAAMIQMMGWLYPSKFGTEPPFDRHDWYVSRTGPSGATREVRYVIDYYSGPPEPTGEPVFYLDVRPAANPTGAAERLVRWGGDVWWRASGGESREANAGATARK